MPELPKLPYYGQAKKSDEAKFEDLLQSDLLISMQAY